jgi:hypothetical protein
MSQAMTARIVAWGCALVRGCVAAGGGNDDPGAQNRDAVAEDPGSGLCVGTFTHERHPRAR